MCEEEVHYIYEDDDSEIIKVIEDDSQGIAIVSDGGSSGSSDYEDLYNKPSINDVQLKGNKTSEELNLQDKMEALSEKEIEEILKGIFTGE